MKTLEYINNQYPYIKVDKYIVMPNHVHLIVILQQSESGRDGTLPLHKIIGQLKSFTNKKFNDLAQTKNSILWQRNYFDHVIRNESEYLKKWSYIDTNPLKWEEDKYYLQS